MVTLQHWTPSTNTVFQSCIATLYIAISYILYWDSMLPLLIATGADSMILIACIVVACTVGKPVCRVRKNCEDKRGESRQKNIVFSEGSF